jgi:hypothetical protein
MKALYLLLILLTINGYTQAIPIQDQDSKKTHKKHSFQDVWSEVVPDPYSSLPQNTVTFGKLFTFTKNIILNDAKRTLADHRDIIEPFGQTCPPQWCMPQRSLAHTQSQPL